MTRIGPFPRWRSTIAYRRGDVVLVPFPFTEDPAKAKRRPAVIVQADRNNARLSSVIVAQITSNVTRAEHEPTQFLIQRGTPAARAAGLLTDSAIKCETLATISKRRVIKRIGHLLPEQMRQLEACLGASLDLPQPTS